MHKKKTGTKAGQHVRRPPASRVRSGRGSRTAERAGLLAKPAKKTRREGMIGGKTGAACDELLALLNAYIDGGVSPKICRALEGHLAGCNPCRVVVDNVRQTITLYRANERCELPARFRASLHAAIRDCRQAKAARRTAARKRGST